MPFCPPRTSLFYAGDFDTTDSNANGLYNSNHAGVYGATWVGVKPPKAATVTGATFNQLFTSGFTGTNRLHSKPKSECLKMVAARSYATPAALPP